jgi:hypothetical protein
MKANEEVMVLFTRKPVDPKDPQEENWCEVARNAHYITVRHGGIELHRNYIHCNAEDVEKIKEKVWNLYESNFNVNSITYLENGEKKYLAVYGKQGPTNEFLEAIRYLTNMHKGISDQPKFEYQFKKDTICPIW